MSKNTNNYLTKEVTIHGWLKMRMPIDQRFMNNLWILTSLSFSRKFPVHWMDSRYTITTRFEKAPRCCGHRYCRRKDCSRGGAVGQNAKTLWVDFFHLPAANQAGTLSERTLCLPGCSIGSAIAASVWFGTGRSRCRGSCADFRTAPGTVSCIRAG